MIDFEELYFTPDSLSRLARKLRGSMSQREVADKANVSQSNVSKVENDPGSRPETAVRIIEAISDYKFAGAPRYRIAHRPGRDFSGDTYESLAYHLRVLFFISWKARSLMEIRDQYPGRDQKGRYVETGKMRLKVGTMSKGAVVALQDLLERNLLDYSIDAYSFEERWAALRLKYKKMADGGREGGNPGLGLSEAQIEAAIEEALSSEPGEQGPDCYYLGDDGKEISLEGKAAYCSFSTTSDGQVVVEKVGGGPGSPIMDRITEEESDLPPLGSA